MIRLSFGLQFTRITLLILNILFILFGVTLFGFGIYLAASKNFDVAFFEDVNVQIIGGDAIQGVGITLIIVGFLTVILSAFGGLGALRKNRLFLYLYGAILIILMLSELAAFITALSLRVRVRDSYESSLRNVYNDAYKNNRTDIRDAVEKLEKKFECCGVNNSKDYESINYTIPASCYKNEDMSTEPFGTGCADAIIDWIWDEMPIVGGIIGAILIMEIFGVISSFSLASAIFHYSYAKIHDKVQFDWNS